MTLKLITFDVTNTLLRIRGSVGEQYAAVANKYYGATGKLFDSEKTEHEFVRAFKEFSRKWPNFGYENGISSEDWWNELVSNMFVNLGLKDTGILKSISNQLFTDFCCKDSYELFPETRNTITKLKQTGHLQLGVISNFDERLDLLLEQLEIKSQFDFVLCSRLIGMTKPDAEIFSSALSLAGVETPSEAVHLGDNLDLDYRAAKKAGMNAFLLRRHGSKEINLNGNEAINVIHSLEEILPFVLKRGKNG